MIAREKLKFSVGLAFLFSVGFALPMSAWAAELSFRPLTTVVGEGESFVAEVWLHTEGDTLNALEAKIFFPKETLKVMSLDIGGSPLGLWVKEPTFSNETGEISFSGGIPGGFSDEASIMRIVFQGEKDGLGIVKFSLDSRALLHDGKGTSAAMKLRAASYRVSEMPDSIAISSPTHQNAEWSKLNDVVLLWPVDQGTDYSYLLTNDLAARPDMVPETEHPGKLEVRGLEDGVYYFRIRRKLAAGEWGNGSTFILMIDRTPPEALQATVSENPLVSDESNFVTFAGKDMMSGIDHYEVCLKEGVFGPSTCAPVSNPYVIAQSARRVMVKAVDKAGNEREVLASIVLGKEPSRAAKTIVGAVLGALILAGLVLARRTLSKKYAP